MGKDVENDAATFLRDAGCVWSEENQAWMYSSAGMGFTSQIEPELAKKLYDLIHPTPPPVPAEGELRKVLATLINRVKTNVPAEAWQQVEKRMLELVDEGEHVIPQLFKSPPPQSVDEGQDELRNIMRKVRDAGALDDNNGGENWTVSDQEVENATAAIRALITREKAVLEADIAHAIGYCQGLGHPNTYLEKRYPTIAAEKAKPTNPVHQEESQDE